MILHPNSFIRDPYLRQKAVAPQFINGRMDHYGLDPAHEHHLRLVIRRDPEGFQFVEHFYKAVVHYIHRLVITRYIPEYDLQAIAIVMLIQILLVPAILLQAAFYDMINMTQ